MDILVTYQDLATPRLRSIVRQLGPGQRRKLLVRLGKTLEAELKRHFREREGEGNKQGFPRQHWWAREVRAKTALREADDDRAVVGIASRQFASILKDTTIKPGPGKRFLALPMRPEAYGVRPSAGTIPGIFPIRSKVLGKAWLATRENGALRFYWRLVPSVFRKADLRALPPVADLQAVLEAEAETEVVRILKQ